MTDPSRKFNRAADCRRICILGAYDSRRFEQRDLSLYRCGAGDLHPHFSAARVRRLVREGQMEWVGTCSKIARFVQARTWQALPSGPVKTMQMVPGGILQHHSRLRRPQRAEAHGEVRSRGERS